IAFLVTHYFVHTHLDTGMQVHLLVTQGTADFLGIGKHHAFARRVNARTGDVVKTEYHVLCRHDDRFTVCRGQDVVGRHHQRTGFELGFQCQRYVYRHLVTVEVGVERRTHQRVQLDCLAFDQYRLKRLDTQAVQGRRTVQHHRVLADHFRENIPDFCRFALDHLLGGLDGGGKTTTFQLGENERLEQFQSHLLRQTTLVQLEGRANHDHGTAGVVDALAEQVLAEAALLALDHVGQGLQRALVGAGDGTATTTVIQQRINRFLQHALFVAHDDVRRVQLKQALQSVVTVDDATIKIVQVGGRKAAAIQRNQRTQIRRQHRQYGHYHPLGTVA